MSRFTPPPLSYEGGGGQGWGCQNCFNLTLGIEIEYNLAYPSSTELLEKVLIFRGLDGSLTDLLRSKHTYTHFIITHISSRWVKAVHSNHLVQLSKAEYYYTRIHFDSRWARQQRCCDLPWLSLGKTNVKAELLPSPSSLSHCWIPNWSILPSSPFCFALLFLQHLIL